MSDQEPSIVALCDAVKNGWHSEIVPEASPKGESKSNGDVERAVQSVHGLARTLKDFLEQRSDITLESRSFLLGVLLLFFLLFFFSLFFFLSSLVFFLIFFNGSPTG